MRVGQDGGWDGREGKRCDQLQCLRCITYSAEKSLHIFGGLLQVPDDISYHITLTAATGQ